MMSIFSLELQNNKKGVFIWTLSLSASILLLLAFFPVMQSEAMQALANAKLESMNPALLSAFGLSEMPDFTIITHYFGYIMQFITLAFMIFVTYQATVSLIKEESDGTIEFLYAKPISRRDILIQKGSAHLVTLLIMTAAFILTTVIGYLLFSDLSFSETLREAFLLFGGMLFASFVFSGIGFMSSALIKSVRSATGLTIAIVFITALLGTIASITEDFNFLLYLSPIDWVEPQKLIHEGLRPLEWIIGLTLVIGCPLVAWQSYSKKDLLT